MSALVVLTPGCDGPRAIPRVEPVLAGWPAEYVGLAGLEIHAFDTGKFRTLAGLIHRGATLLATRALDVPAYVVRHPTRGLIVFDSGLPPAAATDRTFNDFLDRSEGQDLPAQMRAAGLDPADVSFVVISHLHFDHTGSIRQFPGATLVVARKELAAARGARLWDKVSYHPPDFTNHGETREIDYDDPDPYATFEGHRDLLGDHSLVLVDLAGHTVGSQGLLVAHEGGPVLMTGDASYTDASWRYGSRPLMAYDMDAWWLVSWKIKKFSQLVPKLLVLPGHDLKPAARDTAARVTVHTFEVTGAAQ